MWSLKQGNSKPSILLLRHNQWTVSKRLGGAKCSKFEPFGEPFGGAKCFKIWIAWWSEMLQYWRGEMLQNLITWWSEMLQYWRGEMLQNLNRLMKRNASILNRLMKRNAQIILDWKQLHHEVLKLGGYVGWWDAAVEWGTERVPDHVTQHHLIFICMYETAWFSAGMQRPGPDQPLWDRSVPSICWPRNEAVLQLSDELILRRWPMGQAPTAWPSRRWPSTESSEWGS